MGLRLIQRSHPAPSGIAGRYPPSCYLFHRRVKPLLRTCWKIVRLRTRLPKIHSDFRGGKLPDFRRLKNPVLRMPTGDFADFPPRWKTTNTPYPWIFEAKKTQYMVAK